MHTRLQNLAYQKKVRELIGLRKGQRAKVPIVEQWLAFMHEAMRMKPSNLSFIRHRWPLIEKEMRRYHCLRWCEERQYPKPPSQPAPSAPTRTMRVGVR
jgi:hypothetical protein